MAGIRYGRRRYYDIFSHFYDAFIRLHSRHYEKGTRSFLADTAAIGGKKSFRLLDVCCGTGGVASAFMEKYPKSIIVGYDFSRGMLQKAKHKVIDGKAFFVEGDAAELPFPDGCFDMVTCSHALYELKGISREKALTEMNRVLRADGSALIMEHAVPRSKFLRILFYVRMFAMGSSDAKEFVKEGCRPFLKIFQNVTVSMSPSEKSRLFICQKQRD
jgi:ubiquinone/menaquinone biosynthesis C-methylase UbiE